MCCVQEMLLVIPFKDVMQEVIELFPGPYIHIGGDECPNERWKSCEKCQSWMRKNHISDEYALQSYVIEYVGKYLKSIISG